MTHSFVCYNQIVQCEDCGYHYENQFNGLAIGKKHHNKTGHTVNIDLQNSVTYRMDEVPK